MSTESIVRLLLVTVVISIAVQVKTTDTKNAITDNKAFIKTKHSLLKRGKVPQTDSPESKHGGKKLGNTNDGTDFKGTYGRRLPTKSFGSQTKAKSTHTPSNLKTPGSATDVKLSQDIPGRDDSYRKRRQTGPHKKMAKLKTRLFEKINLSNQISGRVQLDKDRRYTGLHNKMARLTDRSFENVNVSNETSRRDHFYHDKTHRPYKKRAKLKKQPFENATSSNQASRRASLHELQVGGQHRKTRSPQYALGLSPLGLQYPPRVAPLGYRTAPALQSLGQYRGLIPSNNGLASPYRLPYTNIQLARLLALLQHRAQISGANGLAANGGLSPQNAGGIAADVHVYKPGRLKYNSIPATPNVLQQELTGGQLGAVPLLALNPLNSIAGTSEAFGDLSDDSNLDELGGVCRPNPCHNGGTCSSTSDGVDCICAKGFTGKRCQERNPCFPNPCGNDGQCTVSGSSFECSCTSGWKGQKCEDADKCLPNPCMNGGQCTELYHDYECTCLHGYRGKSCEEKRSSCSSNPCLNNGRCMERPGGGFECLCKPGYDGMICSVSRSKCLLSPCQNGGSCSETMSGPGYECQCLAGFRGETCEERSPCNSRTCSNGGTCFETGGGFKCICRSGFSGRNCEVKHNCLPDTCRNGARCIEHENGFKCVCSSGYKGVYCDDIDHCRPNPCQNDGECVENGNGYKCNCQSQYQGQHCEDLNKCVPNPCLNSGQCIGFNGGFKCDCLPGFKGENCEEKTVCDPNPCHNDGFCSQDGDKYKCSCKRGYTGDRCTMVDSCLSNPCQNSGTCQATEGGFLCKCTDDRGGRFCEEQVACHPNPCHNGAKCLATSDGFVCRCPPGYRGDLCAEEDECTPNPCQNGGRCISHYFGGGFNCECPMGFRGSSCNDKDPCHPNPCGHNGICNEFGGGITCNCSLGFKGPTCQEVNRCLPNPCQHAGRCTEVVGGDGFACQCSVGYRGQRCAEKDTCHPNPCLHEGQCMQVNDALGFLCNCSLGFKGDRCQDVDPCQPNPCQNSGTCIHTSDGFVCDCSIGYKGSHCQNRDLCKPNPCQFGNKCQQTGIDSYQCVKKLCEPNPCQNGGRCIEVNDDDFQCVCGDRFTGKTCRDLVQESNALGRHKVPEHPIKSDSTSKPTKISTVHEEKGKAKVNQDGPCAVNPCVNGGTCLTSDEDSFLCRCAPSYGGATCEESKKHEVSRTSVDFCSPNPCKNKGVCVVEDEKSYSCVCQPGFTGFHCQADHCKPNPCRNRGACLRDKALHFKCDCNGGYSGKFCEDNNCHPNPCMNGGICVSVPNKGYQCKCRDGFSGPRCLQNPCVPNPCNNGGKCMVFYTVYLCKCPRGHRGTKCDILVPSEVLAPAPALAIPPQRISDKTGVRKSGQSVDHCHPNPCEHNGVCLRTIEGSYECFCRGDFSGPRCEDVGQYKYSSAPKFFPGKGEECRHCARNAHCVGGHCICKNGFVGDGLECWVETQKDKTWTCDVNPCKNGGTCKPGISKCVCRLGYVGDYCETYCPPIVHLSFDKFSQSRLLDDSGSGDDGLLADGAQIVPHGGKCGNSVNLQGGDILFDGEHFRNIPRKSITIATWIKLETNRGIQSIFDTIGSHSKHRDGQYHFEVDDGRVRWFHRNENYDTIFSVLSEEIVPDGIWTQITVTYTSKQQRARIYVNGDLVAEGPGRGLLSGDWGAKAGIGKHQHIFGNRLLRGMVDEFFIFPCELPRLEVLVLMRHCKVYFGNKANAKPKTKTKTQEEASFRSSQAIMTPPTYWQRIVTNTNPYSSYAKVYRPPIPVYRRPSPPPFYQSRPQQVANYVTAPVASPDYVAQNLKTILASFEDKSPPHPARPQIFSSQQQIPAAGQQRAQVTGMLGARVVPRLKGQSSAPFAYPHNVASLVGVGEPLRFGKNPEIPAPGVQEFSPAQSRQKWTMMPQTRQQVKPVAVVASQPRPQMYVQAKQTLQTTPLNRLSPPLAAARLSIPVGKPSLPLQAPQARILPRPPQALQTTLNRLSPSFAGSQAGKPSLPLRTYPQARISPGPPQALQTTLNRLSPSLAAARLSIPAGKPSLPLRTHPQARISSGPPQALQTTLDRLSPSFASPRISVPARKPSFPLRFQLPSNALNRGLQTFSSASKTPYAPYQAYSRPYATKVPASWPMKSKLPTNPLQPALSRTVQRVNPRPQIPARSDLAAYAVSKVKSPIPWQTANARLFTPKMTTKGFQNPAVKTQISPPAVYSSPSRPQLLPRPAAPQAPLAPAAIQVSSYAFPNLLYGSPLKDRVEAATTGRKQKPQLRYVTVPYSTPTNVHLSAQGVDGRNVQSTFRPGGVVVLRPGQLMPYYKTILAQTGRSPQLLFQLQKFLTSSLSQQQQQQRLTDKLRLGQPSTRAMINAQHTPRPVASLWFPGDPMRMRVFARPPVKRVLPGFARPLYFQSAAKNDKVLAYSRGVPLYLQSLPYKVFYLNKRDSPMVVPSTASIKRYVTQALSSVLSELGKKKRKRGVARNAKT